MVLLKNLSGEAFTEKFAAYIKPYFRKALPSLFSQIKCLYKNSEKVKIIEKNFKENNESLKTKGTFTDSKEEQETPCCLLWSYMVLAQHYDLLKKYDLAVENINKALDHTPTLIELYLVKAKIYKHLKSFPEAIELSDQARKLDLADRYLNNQAIKYLLK